MSLGKKILSAFIEIEEEKKESHAPETKHAASSYPAGNTNTGENHQKFSQYFDKLFKESNMPGPDYFEFSKMTEAMSAIPDERARFAAAFAGLAAQGLSKTQLLETAKTYLGLITQDATNFNASINAAVTEKVNGRQHTIQEKTKKIQELSREITDLNNQIAVLANEIKEDEEKIKNSASGYNNASEMLKSRIEQDIEKIKQYLN